MPAAGKAVFFQQTLHGEVFAVGVHLDGGYPSLLALGFCFGNHPAGEALALQGIVYADAVDDGAGGVAEPVPLIDDLIVLLRAGRRLQWCPPPVHPSAAHSSPLRQCPVL